MAHDPPTIGPAWTAAFAPDGDGLAGLGPVTGVVGSDVLLATLHFEAIGIGTTALVASITAGDLTEGFPLVAGGFALPTFEDGSVDVATVPEPRTGVLMALGLAWLARHRRRRRMPGSRTAG